MIVSTCRGKIICDDVHVSTASRSSDVMSILYRDSGGCFNINYAINPMGDNTLSRHPVEFFFS